MYYFRNIFKNFMYKHIKTLLYFYNAEYIFNNYIDKN